MVRQPAIGAILQCWTTTYLALEIIFHFLCRNTVLIVYRASTLFICRHYTVVTNDGPHFNRQFMFTGMCFNGEQDEMPKFVVPLIQDNPKGWGPSGTFEMPDRFKDMPYQPFNKGDRLGKICDFTKTTFKGKKNTLKFASKSSSGTTKCRGKDEGNFSLVDNTRVQKHPPQRGRFRDNRRNQRGRGGHTTVVQGDVKGKGGCAMVHRGVKDKEGRGVVQGSLKDKGDRALVQEVGVQLSVDPYKNSIVRKWEHRGSQIKKNRSASVPVGSDWIDVQDYDFPRGKLSKDQRWLLLDS